MVITANMLYRDTISFIRNQLIKIIFISIIFSFFVVFFDSFLHSDKEIITTFIENKKKFSSIFEYINSLTLTQKYTLLYVCVIKIFLFITNISLFVGVILSVIDLISSHRSCTLINLIKKIKPVFFQIFIQTLIIRLLINSSFAFFMLPSIFIAILLSLSPIILFAKRIKLWHAFQESISVTWKNLWIIAPIILFSFLIKMIFLIFLKNFIGIEHDYIFSFLINFVNNLFYAIELIYLSRLYMLLPK
ncbi:YciC family protein [Candidatus Tachikawaea gelatinosa]|nr:YciC family protein [Candidatus Tachikawaea gelatinosa]